MLRLVVCIKQDTTAEGPQIGEVSMARCYRPVCGGRVSKFMR